MNMRPVRKLYTPIERIPPLYPPHSDVDDALLYQTGMENRKTGRQQAPNPVSFPPSEARLPPIPAAAPNGMMPSAASSPSYPTYTPQGLKRSHYPPKGTMLDVRA